MGHTAPTQDEWRNLYEAAGMFKELAPWRWILDADVFGIQNPETGEIGYCCVMGALGEVLGLAVYLGSEGLSLFEELQAGKTSPENEDIHLRQNCLAITFDDRSMLEKQDLDLIKRLGLKFRGRRTWPCFRSHRPGYVPWFLNAQEARFLNLALRYAMLVAEKIAEKHDLLKSAGKGEYRIAYVSKENEKVVWREKWVKPTPHTKRARNLNIDELRLARIKTVAEQVADVWEVDFFFAPMIIDEGDRPFFPYVGLYAVHQAHYILNFCLAEKREFSEICLENFLEMLEKLKVLPRILMVRSSTVYAFFKPLADRLGVQLKNAKNLDAIEHAKESFINHLGKGV